MVFVINKKKYDTNKMELVTNKFRYEYKTSKQYSISHPILGGLTHVTYDTGLYKSEKGNWLVVFDGYGRAVTEKEARDMLLKHDYKAYEKQFGKLEEA